LGEGAAGHGHDGGHVSEGVGTSFCLSESIRCGGFGVEDGGVDLGLLVGSSTWDDAALDTETSGVSSGIASHDCNLAMGGDERGCCESNEEELGQHICGYLVV